MLDQKLKELLDFAQKTDIQELAWEKDGMKIHFRRAEGRALPIQPAATHDDAPYEEAVEPQAVYIKSTMVGTFLRGDSSDRPPFVVEGTLVEAGEPVGSIEAMKIRKDVLSPLTCRIVKSLVADGHSVEYGQPLFEVKVETGAN